jgi:O-antigen/teichoic acid export membrane protein
VSDDSLGGQAAKGTAWIVISRLVARLLDAVLLLLLARLLDPRDFGLVALAAALIAIVDVFRDLGLQQAAVQRRELTRAHVNSLFWGALGLAATLAGVLAAGAGLVADLLGSSEAQNVVALLAISLPLQAVSMVPTALLQRSMDFRAIAVTFMIGTAIGGAVGVALALTDHGVYSLVFRTLAQALVTSLLLAVFARFLPQLAFKRQEFMELFRFGLPIAGARFLEVVQGRADDLLIGRFMGPALLGTYSVAYRLYRILTETFIGTMSQVAAPTFSKLQSDRQRLLSAYYTSISVTTIVAVPVMVGLAAVAGDLVPLLFGDQWVDAVPVMQVLALVGVLHSVRYYDAALLVAVGRPALSFRLRIATFIPTFIGFLAVVHYRNLLAFVAVYAGVGWFISAPIWLYALKRTLGVSPFKVLHVSARPVLAAALMYSAIAGYRAFGSVGVPAVDLGLQIMGGASIYFGIMFAIDRSGMRTIHHLIRGVCCTNR